MSSDQVRRPVGRRSLLGALGGAGALLALRDRRPPGAPPLDVAAQSTPAAQGTPAAEWTPPPIPEPLPKPGGTPPPVVGAAPAAAPATSLENPSASPVAGQLEQAEVQSPGQPPQPVASPAANSVAAAAPSATVNLTPDFTFSPDKVSVKTGQAVRWVNQGRSPQTVTCDPARAMDKSLVQLPSGAQPWDSGVLNWGEDFVHVFDTPGTYGYFSMPQGKQMTGQVEVAS